MTNGLETNHTYVSKLVQTFLRLEKGEVTFGKKDIRYGRLPLLY
jgi:hypothetical protein